MLTKTERTEKPHKQRGHSAGARQKARAFSFGSRGVRVPSLALR